ncbi:MAG TPA: FHA domain-containing protein, partial [Gemmatimonadaceae bacterium]|nr:FHA domain-containing protein [Gemmatimonadaceae bacterium]
MNGVQLGVEPHPLIHGDKVDVAGTELLYGDDRKGGQTQYITGASVAGLAEAYMPGARPVATTGGRLVSLVDGREYTVGPTGLTLGRDAGCDVVVASPEVSRRHAELAAGA